MSGVAISPYSSLPPQEVCTRTWRQTYGDITAVADDSMRFVGVAFGGAKMRADTLHYQPAADGCAPEYIAGTPIVLDHLIEAEAVVGIVEFAWREGKALHVVGRLSPTKRALDIWPAIADGALRGLSFTVSPEELHRDGDTVHVTKWRPVELSICATGWDPDAKIDRFLSKEDILWRMLKQEEKRRAEAAAALTREAVEQSTNALFQRTTDLAVYIAAEMGIDRKAAIAAGMRFIAAGSPKAVGIADTP